VTAARVEPPVDPRLFSLVTRYAKAIDAGKVSTKRPLSRDTLVVQFCVTFFQQFCEHEVGFEITGIDEKSKAAATRRRVKLGRQRNTMSTQHLLFSFEDLCDAWPNILGFGYGGSTAEFISFHTIYVPRLLERIVAWARDRGFEDVAKAAQSAADDYVPASERL